MANILNTLKKLFWTTPKDAYAAQDAARKRLAASNIPGSSSGGGIKVLTKPKPIVKSIAPDVISGAGYTARVGMTPPSPTGNIQRAGIKPPVKTPVKPASKTNNVAVNAAKSLIKTKTNNQNPTSTANQQNNMLGGVTPYAGGTVATRPTAVPQYDTANMQKELAERRAMGATGTTPIVPQNQLTAQDILNQTGFSQLEKDLSARLAAGQNGTQTPEGNPDDLSQYLDEAGAGGAFGLMDNKAPLAIQDYIKQAIEKLAPGLIAKLSDYKTSLDNTLTGYDSNAKQVSLNADGSITDNTRATQANVNNFSNSSLSRGIGRSSIATTGMGELGVIGARQEGEIKASRDAALANIAALKSNAAKEYESNVASLKAQNVAEANSQGTDLYNQAVDRNLQIEQYNKETTTAKTKAAMELRDKAVSSKQKATSDTEDRAIEREKIKATMDKNEDTKVINQQKVDIEKSRVALEKSKAAEKAAIDKVKTLQTEKASAAKIVAAKAAQALAEKKRVDAQKKADADRNAKLQIAQRNNQTSTNNNIRTTNTSAANNKRTVAGANSRAASKTTTTAKKGLPEMSAGDYTKARNRITSVISRPETPANKAARDAAIKQLIAEYKGAQDGPKKAELLRMLGVK